MINLKNLDKFLNSTSLTASIFLVSGGYKTYKDYRAANLKYKKKFLIKDCVVLSGAAAGMLANRAMGKKIVKNSFNYYFAFPVDSYTLHIFYNNSQTRIFF